jgi:hypothetical protein
VKAITPMHKSLLKTNFKQPKNMERTKLPDDMRTMIEEQALAIFADMSNAGCSLQQTLAAVYLSGMNAAMEASR